MYNRVFLASYLLMGIFAFFFIDVIFGDPILHPVIEVVIMIVSLFLGMWQHTLRYKYNPKEAEELPI